MKTPYIAIVLPDPDLRRSVEFVLTAHGYRSALFAEVGSGGGHVALTIVDEDALPPAATEVLKDVNLLVLSPHARPSECPAGWTWMEKSHLGQALAEGVENAIRRSA